MHNVTIVGTLLCSSGNTSSQQADLIGNEFDKILSKRCNIATEINMVRDCASALCTHYNLHCVGAIRHFGLWGDPHFLWGSSYGSFLSSVCSFKSPNIYSESWHRLSMTLAIRRWTRNFANNKRYQARLHSIYHHHMFSCSHDDTCSTYRFTHVWGIGIFVFGQLIKTFWQGAFQLEL